MGRGRVGFTQFVWVLETVVNDKKILDVGVCVKNNYRYLTGEKTRIAKAPGLKPGRYSIQPPLTLTTWPVTYSASSEAKKATAAATSSVVGGRPMGKRASRILRASSIVSSFSSMLEGFTTFTVMPFLASSSASERESATTAAFAAAYAEIFAWPNARSAPTAPILMMRPQRPLRMCGRTARLT